MKKHGLLTKKPGISRLCYWNDFISFWWAQANRASLQKQ